MGQTDDRELLFDLLFDIGQPHQGEPMSVWKEETHDGGDWHVSMVVMGETLTTRDPTLDEALRRMHGFSVENLRKRVAASLPTADDVRGILG